MVEMATAPQLQYCLKNNTETQNKEFTALKGMNNSHIGVTYERYACHCSPTENSHSFKVSKKLKLPEIFM